MDEFDFDREALALLHALEQASHEPNDTDWWMKLRKLNEAALRKAWDAGKRAGLKDATALRRAHAASQKVDEATENLIESIDKVIKEK